MSLNREERKRFKHQSKKKGDLSRKSAHKMNSHLGMNETRAMRVKRLTARVEELESAIGLLKQSPHIRNQRHKLGRLYDELGRVNAKLAELK